MSNAGTQPEPHSQQRFVIPGIKPLRSRGDIALAAIKRFGLRTSLGGSWMREPMPKGPKGEKRPADVIGNAIMVAKIATGEIEESTPAKQGKEYARKGGLKGGK